MCHNSTTVCDIIQAVHISFIDTLKSARMSGYLLRTGSHDTALRRATCALHQRVVLLRWRFQPTFDIQNNPRFLRMFPDGLHHQFPIDVVEETTNVQIEHPIVIPTMPPGLSYRV